MPEALFGAASSFEAFTGAWAMRFSSVHYLLFLPLVAGAYFLLPKVFRRPWLLIASYYFYFFAAPRHLVLLLAGTLFTWLCGLALGRAQTARAKRGWMIFSVLILVAVLAFFKYNGAFADVLGPFFARLGIDYAGGAFTVAAAVGISFYTFTAIAYLVDVSRGDVPAERNLLNVALLLGFFPSVQTGPIVRAGEMLPPFKDSTRRFDAQNAADALRRIACGFFKKLAVADTLAVFVNAVYGNLQGYTGLTLTLAALGYMLQLYFDFSGYSDIAIGSAKLLGFKLPENFANPYFSTNFSTFWQRWHISVSTWLQDYIFTPLVWSRWTEKLPFIGKRMSKPPVLSALFAVFFVSGLWHGDTLCFLVWGVLQAAFRIGEELLHRSLGKPKKKLHPLLKAGKMAVVLILWTESLVFFRVGTAGGSLAEAAGALWHQFIPAGLSRIGNDIFSAIANGFFNKPFMVVLFIAFTLVCLALALWADWLQNYRLKNAPLYEGLRRLPTPARYAIYYVVALCCFAGFLAQSGGFGGGGFIYGGI